MYYMVKERSTRSPHLNGRFSREIIKSVKWSNLWNDQGIFPLEQPCAYVSTILNSGRLLSTVQISDVLAFWTAQTRMVDCEECTIFSMFNPNKSNHQLFHKVFYFSVSPVCVRFAWLCFDWVILRHGNWVTSWHCSTEGSKHKTGKLDSGWSAKLIRISQEN